MHNSLLPDELTELPSIVHSPPLPLSPSLPRSVFLTILLCYAPPAWALIDPDFTPVQLVKQSEQILLLELGPVDAAGRLPTKLVKALLGKPPEKPLVLDLTALDAAQAKELRGLLTERSRAALVFVAQLPGQPKGDASKAIVLHVAGRWYRLVARTAVVWQVDALDRTRQSTWNGATEMLARAVEYILADPQASLPAKADATWGKVVQAAGRIDGAVHDAQAVDIAGTGQVGLLVRCSTGDRFLQWHAASAELRDETARLKLGSKSTATAWGYFNDDPRLDLASLSEGRLEIWLQSANGTFAASTAKVELGDECVGLLAIESLQRGQSSLVASFRRAVPALLVSDERGDLKPTPLPSVAAAAGTSDLGVGGPCVVGDFDADGHVDLVQPFVGGAQFYAGEAPLKFKPPQPLAGVTVGGTPLSAATGDYDADGLLDVLLTSPQGLRLWTNIGGGQFRDTLAEAGEPAQLAGPHTIAAAGCDINNDGRQDFFAAYADRAPQLFFNRGFRCFGLAASLDVEKPIALLPAGSAGQQAAVVADFNGDGCQDLALVSTSGEVRLLLREVDKGPKLGLTVRLPRGATGPVRVWAFEGKRPLGAQLLAAGSPVLFGKTAKGPLTLKWRLGAEAEQSKQVIVLKPTALELPAESR